MYEDLPYFDKFLKENYTDFAVNKIRYNAAKGLNLWKIHQEDKDNYLLHYRNPTEEMTDDETFIPKMSWCKLRVVNDLLFCSCMDYFNTGLPCEHQMLVLI